MAEKGREKMAEKLRKYQINSKKKIHKLFFFNIRKNGEN